MANTYTQCHFHLVFAVKNRYALIKKEWRNETEMYITGIVQNFGLKMLTIGSMPDHILIVYNVNQLIPEIVGEGMNKYKYYGALHLCSRSTISFL